MSQFIAAVSGALAISATVVAGDAVLFVDDDALPGGDGLSWETAYTDLQDALDQTIDDPAFTEVWVAQGTYAPDRGTGDREMSFRILANVRVYGGFAGNEKELEERDPVRNLTTLTGDLNGDDGPDFANYDDNSFHIVDATNAFGNSILDGFTIIGGNAETRGGGLLGSFAGIEVAQCNFMGNRAVVGGAVYFERQNPQVRECVFVGNTADNGGAIYSEFANVSIVDSHFEDNTASTSGGALFMIGGQSIMTDCVLFENTARYGGALCGHNDSDIQVTGCRFEQNFAFTEDGGTEGGAAWLSNSSAEFVDCEFVANFADSGDGAGTGGALWARESVVTVRGCQFTQNFAASTAGALYATECVVLLEDDHFAFNWSESSAGAVGCYNKSVVTASHLHFEMNFAFDDGGGFASSLSSVHLSDSTFTANISQDRGGGLKTGAMEELILERCEFIGNSSTEGGGYQHEASGGPTLIDCLFVQNLALDGGGLYLDSPGPLISRCTFEDNCAVDEGGGLWMDQGSTTVSDCVFTRNTAGESGGGLLSGSDVVIERCRFEGNHAAVRAGGAGAIPVLLASSQFVGNTATEGAALWGGAWSPIQGCTFAANVAEDRGGAVAAIVATEFRNCIVWDNEDAAGQGLSSQIALESGPLRADYSCLQNLDIVAGVGNIAVDPEFVRPPDDGGDGWGVGDNDDFGDLHLTSMSPCVNAGNPLFEEARGSLDIDGEARLTECRIDIGADESVFADDCNADGVSDSCEIADGISLDCNLNGVPDTCDLLFGGSADCNDNGIPDDCDIVEIYAVSSGKLSPLGEGAPQTFLLIGPPEARSNVRLDFEVFSNLNAGNEYLIIEVDGQEIGRLLESGGSDCPETPDSDELFMAQDFFNDLARDAFVAITVDGTVGEGDCGGESYAIVTVSYLIASEMDADGDGIPDECQGLIGDIDGDGVVGPSDLLILLGAWGRCPDPPEPCEADLDRDGFVGTNDLVLLLGNWT